MKRAWTSAAVVAGAVVAVAVLMGGPTNPPPGPVASTGRTLDEIYNKIPAVGAGEGRRPISAAGAIAMPGSYVLTGNISVSSGNGIVISADHVTLDLNGYSIISTANTGVGVVVSTSQTGVVVRNGSVHGFGTGVSISGGVTGLVLEDLLVRNAKTAGISSVFASIRMVRVRRCTIMDTGAGTVAADGNLTIEGISLTGAGHVIENCVVARLLYNGAGVETFRGIARPTTVPFGGVGNLVAGCTVTHDANITGTGVSMGGSGVYRDNTVMLFSTSYSAFATNGGGNV